MLDLLEYNHINDEVFVLFPDFFLKLLTQLTTNLYSVLLSGRGLKGKTKAIGGGPKHS